MAIVQKIKYREKILEEAKETSHPESKECKTY